MVKGVCVVGELREQQMARQFIWHAWMRVGGVEIMRDQTRCDESRLLSMSISRPHYCVTTRTPHKRWCVRTRSA